LNDSQEFAIFDAISRGKSSNMDVDRRNSYKQSRDEVKSEDERYYNSKRTRRSSERNDSNKRLDDERNNSRNGNGYEHKEDHSNLSTREYTVRSTVGAVLNESSVNVPVASKFHEEHESNERKSRNESMKEDNYKSEPIMTDDVNNKEVHTSNNNSSLEKKQKLIDTTLKKPEILNRNKRMFGSLMGHLGIAKSNLEKENEKIIKQKEYLDSMKKKNEEEFHKSQMKKQKDSISEKFEKKVNHIKESSAFYSNYIQSLQHFLFTSTEPKIAWLPNNHNKTTRELLAKRQEEVGLCFAAFSVFYRLCLVC
jgi:hypothetical protein